jgi:hypothetical protein
MSDEENDAVEINWRPAEEWEREAILRARELAREEAAALVSGILPYASSPDRQPDPDKPHGKIRSSKIF